MLIGEDGILVGYIRFENLFGVLFFGFKKFCFVFFFWFRKRFKNFIYVFIFFFYIFLVFVYMGFCFGLVGRVEWDG